MDKIANSLLLLCLLIAGSCSTATKKEETPTAESQPNVEQNVNQLPNVTLIDPDGKQFSAKTLSGNTILIFFVTDCDHCQREAADVRTNLEKFSNYQLYFISMDDFNAMGKFAVAYKLDGATNVHFLRADGQTVFKELGSVKTPTILVYDGAKKLTKRFDGETKAVEIIKVL